MDKNYRENINLIRDKKREYYQKNREKYERKGNLSMQIGQKLRFKRIKITDAIITTNLNT